MGKKEKAEGKTEKKVFAVSDIAEALGKEPFEVRALLRKAGVEKADGKYQWTGQKEFDAVVKSLKGGGKAKADADEKPAKKKAPEDKAGAAPETKGKKDRVKPNAKRGGE